MLKENENNKGNERQELIEFISKDPENRLTAINSKDSKDSFRPSESPEIEQFEEEKTCSMKEGSIQGGIFALSSLALGTGAFSLLLNLLN